MPGHYKKKRKSQRGRGHCGKTKSQGCKCQYGKGLFNKLINAIPSSDKTARPRYPGEKHAILKLKGLRTGIANYCGPGTHIVERVRRGDPPRTYSDGVCNIHDIDYALSQGKPDRVRTADRRMIQKLKNAGGKDSIFNIKLGQWAISAKNKAEDLGLLKKGAFGGPDMGLDDATRNMLLKRRAALVQKGYGRRVSIKPPGKKVIRI